MTEMTLKEAIEVLKSHKDRDDLGSKVYEAIDTVVAELEKPIYTAQDMEAFSEWCRIEGFFYAVNNKIWCNYYTETITEKTTAQLRKLWEERGRNE